MSKGVNISQPSFRRDSNARQELTLVLSELDDRRPEQTHEHSVVRARVDGADDLSESMPVAGHGVEGVDGGGLDVVRDRRLGVDELGDM